MTVVGYILLPAESVIQQNSCLRIRVTDTRQCKFGSCDRKVYYEEKILNFVNNKEKIRYQITMEVDSNMLFSITATINNGWCGDTTRKGDYLNDVAHSFERVAGKTVIRKDVAVIQYGKPEDEGITSLEAALQTVSENMQQIYSRAPMSKCDFNKVASQLY